jgi:transcriptional antiterminator RfaH
MNAQDGSTNSVSQIEQIAWYCVRTQPKHEHIAAAKLRQDPDVEVFLPRIRYQRFTKTGPAWVTEALFLNYLFARFELSSRLRLVQAARGVRGVVHFGEQWPSIPDATMADLKAAVGFEDVRTLSQDLLPGDTVEIAGGVFDGLQAVVTRAMSGPQRVAVLLDFLGRQATVELNRSHLIRSQDVRLESNMALANAALNSEVGISPKLRK